MQVVRYFIRLATIHDSSRSAATTTKAASILQLTNVESMDTVTKLDTKMNVMTTLMREHEGFEYTTRYVSENRNNNNNNKEDTSNDSYEYELYFIFDSLPSLETWKTSTARDIVHAYYLEALDDCGVDETSVKGGTRLVDTW
mmetsp:Transcript_19045/g.29328  ORF Transcript_19045/g.29328 Transcript_19045/m.29328 type:complete len:142 (+) Transcript_19045:158-583(+)